MPLTLRKSILPSTSGWRAPATTVRQPDPAPDKSALTQPISRTSILPALKVKTQIASCVSRTRAFVAKSLSRPKPNPKSKPLCLCEGSAPHPTCASTTRGHDPAVKSKVSELVVIAIVRIECVGKPSLLVSAIPEHSSRSRVGSLWRSSSFQSSRQQQPQFVQCSIQYGDRRKKTRAASVAQSAIIVDEKFVFGRLQSDPTYEDAVISISSAQSADSGEVDEQAAAIGQVVIDVEQEFRAADAEQASPGPLRRSSAIVSPDGATSSWEVHYILHRLPVVTPAASVASTQLVSTLASVNDDSDLEEFGATFPTLWYLL